MGGRPIRARGMASAALLAAFALATAACAGLAPERRAGAALRDRLDAVARLLAMEDRRVFDPALAASAAASADPLVRGRAALALGRLRSADAAGLLTGLLGDAEPGVRRAAAFAAGLGGNRTLVPALVRSLADPDAPTADAAACALGRIGGPEAEAALRSVLAGPSGPRASAATGLARSREPGVGALLAAAALSTDPAVRRAAAWALARNPQPGAGPALQALLADRDPEVAAWAARGLGLLADVGATGPLRALAQGSARGPAIQALLALERIAAKGAPVAELARLGLSRRHDPQPGVAIAALTLLRRAGSGAGVADALAEVASTGGRRGGVALASLAALEADRAFDLAFPAAPASAPLDLRLGAAEALPLLPAGEVGRWLDALLADPAPRVRMEAVSRLPRSEAALQGGRLERALADPDGSVAAAALDAAAPLASGPGVDPSVAKAWRKAFAAALATGEADLVASALDAAASLAEGGRELLAARRHDPDDRVRERARRLLAEKYGEETPKDARALATRHGPEDYRRVAERSLAGRVEARVETTRGAFTAELLPEAAPMTVESFVDLARRGFFDGTTIHRVVPDFVVQAGDPRGDGTGGPGYSLRDELNPLPYVRGRIGMALSGPDTGGSQWFVTLSRQPHLDGAYTVFGEVTEGMSVVERIEQNDRIVSVRVVEGARRANAGRPAGEP